ncbi:DNA packaging protein UL33 [Falconid herpesvirus 1]|uniref:DNA packaging protein UL33 n=2 Tax=Columbid alphaherpesvirus 1 TaxID=93386 RepID=A0A068ER33_9ALPH|nr:DNA packaging protein UL33 [Falconid herpesvirus 1]YP_009352941.1 DNA packaging protein UL33 [Columbid alphaherpesvirus 1]AID52737.1 DNA packaging protein UL33 [Falconid herpesvirus 1]ARD71358.1 DNA packaging protein UL33 [Columbid alphaherpesvirus 1]
MARQQPPRLVDAIPACDLDGLDVDQLAEKYLSPRRSYAVWFEYLVPAELDVIFPTTDNKLNYLSFTRRLASAVARGFAGGADGGNHEGGGAENRGERCEHDEALEGRSDRFASVINRFLDLHQILRDS